VVSPDVQQCRQRSPVSVVDAASLRQSDPSPSSGYLSNYVSELTGCGNIDSPWRVRALPGQRVNLTLVDFGVASLSDAVTPPPPAAAADTAAAVPSVCQVAPTDCIGCCDCLSFDRNVFGRIVSFITYNVQRCAKSRATKWRQTLCNHSTYMR